MSASSHPGLAFPKAGRIKLSGNEYRKVVHHAYALDNWQCRACGNRYHLTPHHMIKRSRLRLDTVDNILTLCQTCNQAEKDRRLHIEWENQEARTIIVRQTARTRASIATNHRTVSSGEDFL